MSNGLSYCQLFKAPPGSATTTFLGDCQQESNKLPNQHVSPQLAAEAQGLLDVAYDDFAGDANGPQSTNGPSSIYRFHVNADGSLTPFSAITFPGSIDGPLLIDTNGNFLVTLLDRQTGVASIADIPSRSFADGTVSSITPTFTYDPSVGSALAMDPAGNLYTQVSASTVGVVDASTTAVAATTSFAAAYGAPVRNASAPNSSGSLSAMPAFVATPGQSPSITVSEPGYAGQFLESDTCAGKTTVTPHSANGPTATFAVGAATGAGTCVATFRDAGAQTVQVQIGVTTTTLTGSSVRRR